MEQFAVGEQVVIRNPGWIWDSMVATVRGVELPSSAQRHQETAYLVSIDWPDGMRRRYTMWEHQLEAASAPAAE